MVWDQGINYLLARGLKPLGVEVDCLHRAEYDPFSMTPPKWKRSYPYKWGDARIYGAHVFLKALLGDYDVIHIHSFDKCVPLMSALAPLVLHYHGSDIRGRWEDKKKYWSHANRILVSTSDLLNGAPPMAELLPNPIDTEIFKDLGKERVDAALHFDYGAVDLAEKITHDHGLRLIVKEKGTPYAEMPQIFNGYTHYVDIKRDHTDRVLISRPTDTGSLIGLQALACGCEVLTLGGGRPKGLPPQHRPENVAKQLYKTYKEILG